MDVHDVYAITALAGVILASTVWVIARPTISYYASPLAMGKRNCSRQPPMCVTTTDLLTAASHQFCRRLNQLLREHGFDDFVEAQ
jgi:hypothetical protein